MSSFSGISTALSALSAHRRSMDVIGQNIANVNTPGYTRQRAELQEVDGHSGVSLYAQSKDVGNGVTVQRISRAFDSVQSRQVNTQTADHALFAGRADALSTMEGITGEPNNGLSKQLTAMWSAWADASTKAGSSADGAARNTVIGASETVASTLRSAYGSLEQQWSTRADQMQADLTEVNAATRDVAVLNDLIQKGVVTGGGANELMDQRDQLVTRIVELTGASTQESANGMVDLYLGGNVLVQGNRAQDITAGRAGDPTAPLPSGLSDVIAARADGATADEVARGTLVIRVGGSPVVPTSGQLAASVEALSTRIPDEVIPYDAIAAKLAQSVNDLQEGAGGEALFGEGSPVTAKDIKVVGTSKSLVLGKLGDADYKDGSLAKDIASIGVAADGPDALWRGHVAQLAATSSSAAQRAAAAAQVLTNSVTDQQAGSGVNLDEEGAALIAAQRAYQGAARVLTAVDEMLDTLINKTGLVGR